MRSPSRLSLSVALRRAGMTVRVHVYPTLDSTNTQARRMIAEGSITGETPTLLLAHTQTAGRGRMGRSFHSPKNSGLYFTLVCPPSQRVTPAAAVAVASAIQRATGHSPAIKWVNDLYINDEKVCGILAESVTPPAGGEPLILLGIGINVTTRDFPEGLRHPAGCISPSRRMSKRALSRLVAECVRDTLALATQPEACLEAYRARQWLTGRTVSYAYICAPDGDPTPTTVTGVAEGVDEAYSLLLRLPDGQVLTLNSGEVTRIHAANEP